MKISQFSQILEICRCGSFNSAAQNLYISQSSLSSSINSAEQELGTKIFNRTHNGISLTDSGVKFVEAAGKILNIYNDLLSSVTEKPSERLFIASQYIRYASIIFASLKYQTGTNNIEFKLKEINSSEVIHEVHNKDADIGLIVTPTTSRDQVKEYLNEFDLAGFLISVDKARCIVGPKSPLYTLPSNHVSINQLALYPRLAYDSHEWTASSSLFESEFEIFTNNSLVTISDTGSYSNILTQTNCFFIGIYNEQVYDKLDPNSQYPPSLRVLDITDKTLSYDTFWIKRKSWKVTDLAKDYLMRIYGVFGQQYCEDLC